MLFLRNWLEEYIQLSDISNNELAEVITMKSSEVEEIKVIRDWFGGKVLVGKIANVRSHPNADRLNVFDVQLKDRSIQIVSAAENVHEGLIVPVAIDGAVLSGLTIVARPLRGEKSEGMCCGKSELMLETGHSSGLWELNEYAGIEDKLGESICEALPDLFEPQTVLEIKILPDKIGVIGNHLGMALEIASCLGKPELLTKKASRVVDSHFDWEAYLETRFDGNKKAAVTIDVTDNSNYSDVFCLFQLGLSHEYSLPDYAVQRMFFTAKNIIGGLADASNYVLFDVGQPNHFFSETKLKNLATQAGLPTNHLHWNIDKTEGKTEFNGLGQLKKTTIPTGVDILTMQGAGVLAIPAISGGESTKMDEQETSAIIEFASFAAEKVARNSFALNYRSDGAKIWCGQVNARQMLLGLISLLDILPADADVRIITSLLNSEQKGSWKQVVNHVLLLKDEDTVNIDYTSIASRLDSRPIEYWKPEIDRTLTLSGEVADGVYYKNRFFSNLATTEDLLHEVSKHIGYQNLQPQFLSFSTEMEKTRYFADTIAVRELVSSFGFTEIISRPFISGQDIELFHGDQFVNSLLELANPYNSQQPFVRPTLTAHLTKTLSENIQAGFKNVRLFELNKVYTVVDNDVQERIMLEIGMVEDDPYILTTLLLQLINRVRPGEVFEDIKQKEVESGFASIYSIDGAEIARIIEIKNSLKKHTGIPLQKRVFVLSLDVNAMFGENTKTHFFPSYSDESDFPPLKRSYSLLVPSNARWQQILPLFYQYSIEHAQQKINSTERFTTDKGDIVNIDVSWVSSKRTLSNDEVDNWFTSTLELLSTQQIILRS